jgi:hypothetical protein
MPLTSNAALIYRAGKFMSAMLERAPGIPVLNDISVVSSSDS